MKKDFILNKKSNIIETVEHYPLTAKIFAKKGIPCLGCAAARFETLDNITEEFGIDIEELIKEIEATKK